ncbi:hypothetical protein LEP1GSC039_2896 [Leptospira santarosai str. 2000027870]|nr:hypothetical protein LEP1GSC039_2896 [Leptospira santarosai str. 2000027870]
MPLGDFWICGFRLCGRDTSELYCKKFFQTDKKASRDVICRNSYFPKILLLKPSCVSSHILLFTEK